MQTAAREGLDVRTVAEVHFALGQRLGLDRLLARIIELPRDDRWQTMARAALRDDLHAVHAQLTAEVLSADRRGEQHARAELVTSWETVEHRGAGVGQAAAVDHRANRTDLARMSVGCGLVRGSLASRLLPAAGLIGTADSAP